MSRREYPPDAFSFSSPSNSRNENSNNKNDNALKSTEQTIENSKVEFSLNVSLQPLEMKSKSEPQIHPPTEPFKTIENNFNDPTDKEILTTIKKRQFNDFGMLGNHPGISPNSPILELGGLMPQNFNSPRMVRKTPSPTFPYRVQGSPFPLPQFQIHPSFCQTSMNFIPKSQSLLDKLALPFSFDIRPLYPHIEVPMAIGDIIRCRRCRGYMNPYIAFIESGKTWKCNLCYTLNDVPKEYYSRLGLDFRREDYQTKVELSNSLYEFSVPTDNFSQRPPQPPTYFFLIDCSSSATSANLISSICSAIKQSIDNHLIHQKDLRIGFLTFNSNIHYYNLNSKLKKPKILTIDHENVFCPSNDPQNDFLVNLNDSKHLVDQLLSILPNLHFDNYLQDQLIGNRKLEEIALGPALDCCNQLLQNTGGKLFLFLTSTPNVGPGKLLPSTSSMPSLNLTSNTNDMFNNANYLAAKGDYYKNLALDFCRKQISCDVFFFAPYNVNLNVKTLAQLSLYSSGDVYLYQYHHSSIINNNNNNDKKSSLEIELEHIKHDLIQTLYRKRGSEGLIKIRLSKGLQLKSHHGNFFQRGHDVISLPSIHSDHSFTFQLFIADYKLLLSDNSNLHDDGKYYVTIQSSLLYTTSEGDRRIRVFTLTIPISDKLEELYENLNLSASMNIQSKLTISKSFDLGIPNALSSLQNSLSQFLVNYTNFIRTSNKSKIAINNNNNNNSDEVEIPERMRGLPMYVYSLQKNRIYQKDYNEDRRITQFYRLNSFYADEILTFLYPSIYHLNPQSLNVYSPSFSSLSHHSPEKGVKVDQLVDLSLEKLDLSNCVYLLYSPSEFYLWVGQLTSLPSSFTSHCSFKLNPENNFIQIVDKKEVENQKWTYFIQQNDPNQSLFLSHFIPEFNLYFSYLTDMKNNVNTKISKIIKY